MPPKKVIKFGPQNKATIKGKVGHSRTVACTAKGKCYHSNRKTK